MHYVQSSVSHLQLGLTEHTCTGSAVGLATLLLSGSFNLVDNRLWVDPAAVEVALVREQVLRVMFPQRIRGRRRRTDAEKAGDVFPRFILGYL